MSSKLEGLAFFSVSVMIVGGKFVQQPGFRMFSATKALIWSYNMGLGVGAVP